VGVLNVAGEDIKKAVAVSVAGGRNQSLEDKPADPHPPEPSWLSSVRETNAKIDIYICIDFS
jgi:hypothetical protein